MNKANLIVLSGLMLGGIAVADDWTGAKSVKYVEEWGTNDGVQHLQIGTTDGIRYTYHSNSAGCSIDGLKIYVSMALTARSAGDALRFYSNDAASTTAANFTRVAYGEMF